MRGSSVGSTAPMESYAKVSNPSNAPRSARCWQNDSHRRDGLRTNRPRRRRRTDRCMGRDVRSAPQVCARRHRRPWQRQPRHPLARLRHGVTCDGRHHRASSRSHVSLDHSTLSHGVYHALSSRTRTRNSLMSGCFGDFCRGKYIHVVKQRHAKSRSSTFAVFVAAVAWVMLWAAAAGSAAPALEPLRGPATPAPCPSSQPGSDASTSATPGPSGSSGEPSRGSGGECADVGPGGPGYDGTDPRG